MDDADNAVVAYQELIDGIFLVQGDTTYGIYANRLGSGGFVSDQILVNSNNGSNLTSPSVALGLDGRPVRRGLQHRQRGRVHRDAVDNSQLATFGQIVVSSGEFNFERRLRPACQHRRPRSLHRDLHVVQHVNKS